MWWVRKVQFTLFIACSVASFYMAGKFMNTADFEVLRAFAQDHPKVLAYVITMVLSAAFFYLAMQMIANKLLDRMETESLDEASAEELIERLKQRDPKEKVFYVNE